MTEKEYISITRISDYIETGAIKIGEILSLRKEPDNAYDAESIRVYNQHQIPIGYVANSVSSVALGTHSAGYIYRTFENSTDCKVIFIVHDTVIAVLQ